MVFGAALLLLGVVDFFFEEVLFFFEDFFAELFFAGAFFVVLGALVLGEVVEPCACATYGTVDAPTNASRANAEINAFILRYSWGSF